MNAIQRAAVRLAFGGRPVTQRGLCARTIEHALRHAGCSVSQSKKLTAAVIPALAESGFFNDQEAR